MTDAELAAWTARQNGEALDVLANLLKSDEIAALAEDWLDEVLTRETFYLTAKQFLRWLAKESELPFSAAEAAIAFRNTLERRWPNPVKLNRLITGIEWDGFYAQYGGSQRVAVMIERGEIIDFYNDAHHSSWSGDERFIKDVQATYYFPTAVEATFARMYF